MPKPSEARRQRALARKAARRKEARASAPRRPTGGRALLQMSASWPLLECLVTKDWQKPGEIIQIIVARRSPSGQVATGSFLVDLGCLGVKSAFASLFNSSFEYQEKLRRGSTERQAMVPADVNLAAKIIREGVAYARSLGFKPDPDYRDALIVLGEADPDACDTPVPLGKDGKPYFIAGPYDNVPKIMRQLEKAVGPGNFHFMAPLDQMPSSWGRIL